ncbi:MAG: hypothetical protein PHI64_22795 [Zoogloea sp.]|uniref:TRAFAC clade GTPase domain-containing protein n=1 Tax=Zoogloea sp. TaxID=49181 RepID=UPI00260832CA|nr:hypothetical protein [Zoogloea sp.]MDD2991770.1 hypothetical protein [Zoogloea sp.]
MAEANQDVPEAVTCSNPACRVAQTGKCVEGLGLSDCSHYGRRPDDTADALTEEEEAPQVEGIQIAGADTLTPEEASQLLRAGSARVIAVIGPSDAGKTSLIASLYDLYQGGQVAGTEYARSRTLHAFERTCHDARAACRRGTPHSNRTPLGEVRFYHLDLGGGPAADGLALIIGDRAGEDYRNATDDCSTVGGFQEVRRADSITVLVDGERLLNSGKRHNARSDTLLILRALVDGGAIESGQRLALVLTKLDAVLASESGNRAEAFFTSILDKVHETFGDYFSEISDFRVAASPKNDQARRGSGVAELLSFWLQPRPPVVTVPRAVPEFERAYARLIVIEG